MQAGKLDRRITLRKLVERQSSSGAVVTAPQDVATMWAQKVHERGTEAYREGQVQGWAVVVWRTRWFLEAVSEPTVKWEIVEGARVYEVLEVREVGRREGWEFVSRARAEDQA